MDENEELHQLKREMDYYKLNDLENDIVNKYIDENNLPEARRLFNRFMEQNQCKLNKKVSFWAGIFIGALIVPLLWDLFIELFAEILKWAHRL